MSESHHAPYNCLSIIVDLHSTLPSFENSVVMLQRLTPQFKDRALNCIAESFTDPKHIEPFSWIMNLKAHHWRVPAQTSMPIHPVHGH